MLARVRSHLRRGAERLVTLVGPPPQREPRFFDAYPRFYSSSRTNPAPNRLHHRHRALIDANRELIRDRRVLDLASHDGRWSFAAHKAGAVQVVGIEARPQLVDAAEATLHAYGVPEGAVRFLRGEALELLDSIEVGSVDTVFCFGFLYHTLHHLSLLAKIARLQPRHLILDTVVERRRGAFVRVYLERTSREANSATPVAAEPSQALVGVPTRAALALMLESFGWRLRYHDWRNAGVTSWDAIHDYRRGLRVSLVATAP